MELNEDIKLKLLGGKRTPIKIDGIRIIPLNLQEIIDMDYSKYYNHLINLISDPCDYNIHDENITTFDIICSGMIGGDDKYRDFIIDSLSLFIKDDISFSESNGFIINDGIGYLNRSNYEDFKQVLKWQNSITENNNKEFNPANNRANEILDKIMKGRKKAQKQNKTELDDILSSYAIVCGGINIFSIWDMTIYQFYNQTSRYKMFEEYEVGLQSLMAGAKPESVELKYYIRPIEK